MTTAVDVRRLQAAWILSVGLHVLGFSMYFIWREKSGTGLEVVDSVDFIDLIPEETAQPPVEEKKEPASFLDMVKQTLTKVRPQAALEEPYPPPKFQPQDLLSEPQAPKPIDLKSGLQTARPEISLEGGKTLTGARLEEAPVSLFSKSGASKRTLTEAPIALEEVGSVKAARPTIPTEPSITLRGASRRSPLMEQSLAAPVASGRITGPAAMQEAAPVVLKQRQIQQEPRLSAGAEGESSVALNSRKKSSLASEASSAKDLFSTASSARQSGPPAGVLEHATKKAVEISGPISNRKILKSPLPEYPSSLAKEAMAAEVTIQFWVSAEGRVRDKIFLQKTSGFKELDERAVRALKNWLFEASPDAPDQW
ncbi:MAG: TonB family protein, partial [Elusimicrobia bacterium]|nr:TonB family protein [Elusimicrobiota bacterium]